MCAYLVKCALIWYREILSQSLKSLQPMLSQWWYRDICKSTCNLLAEVPAGSRINFEGLAFASKAILEKRHLVVTVSHLHLHIPLSNSNILEKTLIIPLRHVRSKRVSIFPTTGARIAIYQLDLVLWLLVAARSERGRSLWSGGMTLDLCVAVRGSNPRGTGYISKCHRANFFLSL